MADPTSAAATLPASTPAAITLIEAITQALAYEMRNDAAVVVLGEDVGINGGVFRATAGLQQTFGDQRVLDTPLDETTIAGLTVGMASQGMKPVAEAQFDGFMYPMVDFIVCHAARMRYRTRGRLSCPMGLRVPWGGGIRAPEHHSEANESIFTNVPGLRVVLPSSPARAYGLLLAAIRDPDPVIFFEPKRIYRQYKEVVPDDGEALPLDVCYVLRDGSDLTLVTWGAQVKETLEAAEALAKDGISAEVIDVATLKPLDFATIAESVSKTGRCVIVHEAAKTAGFGAEIAARLAEESMFDLVAPVERVTGYDTHIPLFRLEMKYLPSVDKIDRTWQPNNSCYPILVKACLTRPSSNGSSRSATRFGSMKTWCRWKPRRRSSKYLHPCPARCCAWLAAKAMSSSPARCWPSSSSILRCRSAPKARTPVTITLRRRRRPKPMAASARTRPAAAIRSSPPTKAACSVMPAPRHRRANPVRAPKSCARTAAPWSAQCRCPMPCAVKPRSQSAASRRCRRYAHWHASSV